MTSMPLPAAPKHTSRPASTQAGQDALKELRTNEVFVAIVGPAGAGSGTAAKILKTFFEENDFEAEIIKASSIIRRVAESRGYLVPNDGERKSLENVQIMQDRGDELRKGELYGLPEDHSAIARLVLKEIAECRAQLQRQSFSGGPVIPDGTRRAYIIDSLRHPAEVALFREVYQEAFTLLGIVCDPAKREKRIRENLFDRAQWSDRDIQEKVRMFLTRDENAPEKYGQHVSDTFYEADFFVDNSQDAGDNLALTGMNDQIRRFVSLITQTKIVRPSIAETAMHQACSAQMRSACLSRQVGAALVDLHGNIVSTGTNDVPKAGGGLYGESFTIQVDGDERCAFRDTVYCSSNREQNKIIDELFEEFPQLIEGKEKADVLKAIRSTRIGGLIEFSRAVHAEMDAILSASISGTSPRACRMYVTTYPCHYCARHIVASGIDEVQFIEPYPKSKATELHCDSITTESTEWTPPSTGGTHVLFRPFVGVAPNLYRRVFLKDRNYKDKISGEFAFGAPQWGSPTDVYKIAYSSMEAELGLELENV
ncbi:MAG: anti-phage dCTP deaminase [Acetobacter sp.]|uniref:anti-phage dCTP deaminase n=1 Tax=Acetobacter sp. TaxID=440 RepID=UPI003D00D09B